MSVREVVKMSGGLANMSDFLRDAMVSQAFADVTLCCTGGQRFSAHRLVLSAASSYLQRVLSAHGNAAGHYEPITLILADVDSNDLASILGFVYTGCTAVSEERLEAFSSTAEALRIKIPPLPRPLTLSYNQSHLLTDEAAKCKRYYHQDIPNYNVGINMTKSKLNEREYLNEISKLSDDSVQLSGNDCLNLEIKNCHEFSEVKRPRFYVSNRVSASPWCQMLPPHHSPRIQPIVLKNNAARTENIIKTNAEYVEKSRQLQEDIHKPLAETISYAVTLDSAAKVCTKKNTWASPPLVHEEFINEPREDRFTSESLITLLDEPTHGAKINVSVEYSDERRETSDINENNNNNTVDTGSDKDQHKCTICDKFFVSRSSLKVHARLHSGAKNYLCKDCGKEFSQLRNYKYHRSIHEGTGEFSATCPECGKCFNDRGYLGSHMKIHRNRKEYGCDECGKSFNQRVAYNMHMRIHSGVKPHHCDECGKSFSRKMLLKQHLRTHSGERPYQCHICHKAFADRSNMTLHTRLHSGLKPYQCEICTKSFTKKHHLKTHLNYHTGVKPYSCPNCTLSFSQSSNMRTHFKKCLINNKSVNTNDNDDKTCGNNSQISAFSAALTPPYSDLETSSNATGQETIR